MPYVSVHVDEDDVLDDMSTEEIRDYLRKRERVSKSLSDDNERDVLTDVMDRLREGDFAEATLMLERYLYPKWKSTDAALSALSAALGRAA